MVLKDIMTDLHADETYGLFRSDDAYEILRWDTPVPWVNYLTNGNFFSVVSQTGAGFSFLKEYRQHSLIRRDSEPCNPAMPGRAFYLHDLESGISWCPFGLPGCDELDSFKCVHSPGSTRLIGCKSDIEVTLTIAVPQNHNAEVWHLCVKNLGRHQRRIQLIAVADINMGMSGVDIEDRAFDDLFRKVVWKETGLVGSKRLFRSGGDGPVEIWPLQAFMTPTRPPSAWETNREDFLGLYGTFQRPQAVATGMFSNKSCAGQGALMAMAWDLVMEPNTQLEWDVTVGLT